ncbi:hypothetical protein PP304_gp202 [Gordonia phage Phendrix]|nr:hypothetical protein PP304_gp202 [Gordonia phage Phendrix]QDK02752.1 hypothetical protein SEA_PHENDRIX_133 [Gordonia phage Phendrix]
MLSKLTPPFFFCCGWWSPWCVIDTIAHEVFDLSYQTRMDENGDVHDTNNHSFWHWICDKHDDKIRGD